MRFWWVLFLPCSAYALSFSWVGGTTFRDPLWLPQGTFPSSDPVYGGGVLVGFGFTKRVSFEWGFLYLPRSYYLLGGTLLREVPFYAGEMPFLMRVMLLPPLSLGFGGYTAFHLGVSASGWSDLIDLGGVMSLALRISYFKSFALVMDGRYVYGFRSAFVSGQWVSVRELQLLVGLQLGST